MKHLDNNILNRAIDTYGHKNQIEKVLEELAELMVEVCKINHGRTSKDKVIEEIADVEIMLAQLKIIFNISPIELSNMIGFKLKRLENRLTGGLL